LKYKNSVPNSTFFRQVFANFKRRLLTVVKAGKDILYVSIILFFPLMEIIFLTTILKGIGNLSGNRDSPDFKKTEDQIVGYAFPIFCIAGILFSCGAFVVTPVADRELKLRYLLNFAGMRPLAYYLGLLLADYILYSIPITGLLMLAQIMGI
jgi:hypothetical protein